MALGVALLGTMYLARYQARVSGRAAIPPL